MISNGDKRTTCNYWTVYIRTKSIYDENNIQSGVLGAVVLDECLSDQIDDIVVGKTGYAFIRAEGLIPRRLHRGCWFLE